MHAVVGSGDASERVQEDDHVFAGLDYAPAALDHEAGEPDVGLKVLVVGGGNDFSFDGALKIGDFLGALVDEQDEDVHFGMVGGDGVGDLLENGGLAGAGRRDDEAARAFADGSDHVYDARLDEVGSGFQPELFDGVDAREVLEADRFGVFGERHVVDRLDELELGTAAAMGRLERAGDEAAFAQEAFLDAVGRNEDVRGFGMEMVVGRPKEAEAFLGDFQVAGTAFQRVAGLIAHKCRCNLLSKAASGTPRNSKEL